MSTVKTLNKKLNKAFNGKICATQRNKVLYLTGELQDWDDVVRAGLMAVNKKYTVVNDISFFGEKTPPMKLPLISSNILEGKHVDVLIIGGGITGCSIARELMCYDVNVILAEKEHDVAMQASGHNNGMIHAGSNLRLGQLKKKYNEMGNNMYPKVCKELNVPFRRTGQYLCFTDDWLNLSAIISFLRWKRMNISVEYVSRNELLKKEPHLGEKIKFAFYFPAAGVVCPYGLATAYAENAVYNGAKIYLDTVVLDINVINNRIYSVRTNQGIIYPKLVINAAGTFAEQIARQAQDRFFSIHPVRGTNITYSKKNSFLVKSIVSLSSSKSDYIIHTVDDNLIIGSNLSETYDREDFSANSESVVKILSEHANLVPELSKGNILTCSSGIYAATYEDDFIISFGKFTSNIIHAAGIQSPGFTAAPAIAADVAEMAAKFLHAEANDGFNPERKKSLDEAVPKLKFWNNLNRFK
jgi:glycerol-3-phosphate dehydrogenase